MAVLKALKGYKLDENTRDRIISLLTDPNKKIRLLALRVLKNSTEEPFPQ